MAYKLTMEEINKYKSAFTQFDKDLTGKIKPEELFLLMRSLGQNFSNAELAKIAKEADREGHGAVELHKFLDLMARYRKDDHSEDDLIRAFKYFDPENTGFIDYENFKHVLVNVAEKLNLEEIEQLDSKVELYDGKLKYLPFISTLLDK